MIEQEISIPLKPTFRFGKPLSEETLRERGFYVPLYSQELERIKTFLLSSGAKCLLVCGKEGVGKTTLVYKAFADIGKSPAYDNVIPLRFTLTAPKDAACIIQNVYQALLPLTREKPQPKSFVKNTAEIAKSLRQMVPGAKIKIVTEVKDRIGGEAGVSSTKIQIDGQSGASITIELPEEAQDSDNHRLRDLVAKIAEVEKWAQKSFLGIPAKIIHGLTDLGKSMKEGIKGRRNLYIIVLDGLNRLEKASTGEQIVVECLDTLSREIEHDESLFKVIAIAGPRTYKNWHEMGGRSTKAFGIDDALYLSCAWENADLVLRMLIEEPQSVGDADRTRILDDLSAYLRFFSQGRIATALLHLERCCTIEEKVKKGGKSPCLQLNVGLETVKYVAELQRSIEREVLENARRNFHGVEVELDDLLEEVYILLSDLLRTPLDEYLEYDEQSYSFHPLRGKRARARRREVAYPEYLEKTFAILEKMGYLKTHPSFHETKKR